MKKIVFCLVVFLLSGPCYSSDPDSVDYSTSTLFKGGIGKSDITMYLTTSGDAVVGKYIYNKFKISIPVYGNKVSNGIVLNEKSSGSTAVMKLKDIDHGFRGEWCSTKCIPMIIQSQASFKYGEISNIDMTLTNSGNYNIDIKFSSGKEYIEIPDAIDIPSLNFSDLNNDGLYDLIVTTDHRGENGSQRVYISTDNGLVENKSLSDENGTLSFNPFNQQVVFTTKDDCCNKYNKDVYKVNGDKFVVTEKLSFDYSTKKGTSSRGGNITSDIFESY
jgi:hypothetical protein